MVDGAECVMTKVARIGTTSKYSEIQQQSAIYCVCVDRAALPHSV